MDSLSTPTLATQQKANKEQILVRMVRHNSSKEQQAWIDYAFARCGAECVKTWSGESGWVLSAKNVNKNGTTDRGLCQINSQYHKKFMQSEAFKDPYKQLDYCIGIWNDAVKKGRLKTTFYAFNVRNTKGIVSQFDLIYK